MYCIVGMKALCSHTCVECVISLKCIIMKGTMNKLKQGNASSSLSGIDIFDIPNVMCTKQITVHIWSFMVSLA